MTSTVRNYIPISKNLDGRFEVNLAAMNPCLMIFGNLDISNISPALHEDIACWSGLLDSLDPTNTRDRGSCCISSSWSCGGQCPRNLWK